MFSYPLPFYLFVFFEKCFEEVEVNLLFRPKLTLQITLFMYPIFFSCYDGVHETREFRSQAW